MWENRIVAAFRTYLFASIMPAHPKSSQHHQFHMKPLPVTKADLPYMVIVYCWTSVNKQVWPSAYLSQLHGSPRTHYCQPVGVTNIVLAANSHYSRDIITSSSDHVWPMVWDYYVPVLTLHDVSANMTYSQQSVTCTANLPQDVHGQWPQLLSGTQPTPQHWSILHWSVSHWQLLINVSCNRIKYST